MDGHWFRNAGSMADNKAGNCNIRFSVWLANKACLFNRGGWVTLESLVHNHLLLRTLLASTM